MEDTPDRVERPGMPAERRDDHSGAPEEPMGPLGQPVSEPAPRGTFVLLLLFLLLLVASWVYVYLQVWDRGIT